MMQIYIPNMPKKLQYLDWRFRYIKQVSNLWLSCPNYSLMYSNSSQPQMSDLFDLTIEPLVCSLRSI